MFELGWHDVTVLGSALTTAQSGNEQLAIQFQNEAGETISEYLSFSDAAFEYTINKLERLRWDTTRNISELNGGTDSAIAGVKARIKVEDVTGQDGVTRRKVKAIAASNGDPFKNSMDAGASKAFEQKFRARVLANRGAAGIRPAAAPKARAAVPAGGMDDDEPNF